MKIGLFFGAGAETPYGLPSGGTFAIELFRLDTRGETQKLRTDLQNVNRDTAYATKWMPEKFWSKNLYAFGKSEFSSLIESLIENKKQRLVERLGDFDTLAQSQFSKLNFSETCLRDAYRAEFNRELGTQVYSQVIRLNSILGSNGQLFESRYYSAILDVVRTHPEASLL